MVVGCASLTGCGTESGAEADATGEDDVTQARTLYVGDLGPDGIVFLTKRGQRVAELSSPGELTGDEDGIDTGTVRSGRIGGDACTDCLFFQHPRTHEWVNVGRPNGRSIKRSRGNYSFDCDGFVLTNSIVSVTVAENDPDYGTLTVRWP